MMRPSSWSTVIWSVIGLYFAALILANVVDSFFPQVEVGQDITGLVAIMGKPTEKYLEPDLVHGRYVDGATVLVYRYHVAGPCAGDIKVYLKNGKVVDRSRP
jgi:hypothetical protein